MLELGSQIRTQYIDLGAKHPLATEATETAAIPQWGDRGALIPKYKRVSKEEVPAKETEGKYLHRKGKPGKVSEAESDQKGRHSPQG